ncbi:hypothetical protein KKA47_07050 [bacterium]|nr:hypothetical protein [bacterium]
MKKIKFIVVAIAVILIAVSTTAYAVWTNITYVIRVDPDSDGSIHIDLDEAMPGVCSGNGHLDLSSTHPNKRELFSIFLTALSLDKTVKVNYYVGAGGQCWIQRAEIYK